VLRNQPANSDQAQNARRAGGVTPRGIRWGRRGLGLVLVAICIYLCRAYLLRAASRFLVVEDVVAPADYALVLKGDRTVDGAAQIFREAVATHFLVIEEKPGRLQGLGVRPAFETAVRQALADRGLPPKQLTVIPARAFSDWDDARALAGWLDGRPGATVIVLCDRFRGRQVRHVFTKVLPPDIARRVHFVSVPQPSYDETNWWRHKQGLLDLFTAYVRLGYVWICGEDKEEWREWNPDAYEKALRQRS
jgi:hypothetical protein